MGADHAVAVLAPFVGGAYYGEVLQGVNGAAAAAGWRVLAVQTVPAGWHGPDHTGASDLRVPVAWSHFDVAVALPGGADPAYAGALQRAGKPVVLVSHDLPGVRCESVSTDGRAGVREAVRHLVGHGHRRIGFGGDLACQDVRQRYAAYRQELAAQGLIARPGDLFQVVGNHHGGGEKAAAALLEAGMPVTAIVMGTDRNALGLCAWLATRGVLVPDDLAVVGFDNIVDARYSQPALSTVHQPFEEVGVAAFRLARAALDPAAGPVRPRVPATFIARASCGCWELGMQALEEDARRQFDRLRTMEVALHSQYQLGISLLHDPHRDLRDLGWLGASQARAGALALWPRSAVPGHEVVEPPGRGTAGAEGAAAGGRAPERGGRSPGCPVAGSAAPALVDASIETVGGFVADGGERRALPDLGDGVPISRFPPAALIDAADAGRGEIPFVVPIRSPGVDWGFLAAVARIQAATPPGRELVNDSAALLAAALDLHEHRELLRQAALRDHLTGLPNRIHFEDRLRRVVPVQAGGREVSSADGGGAGARVALLFLDLNDFKKINDTLGHAAGDHLLAQVGMRLAAVKRKNDVAARWGGDEFVVLLEDITSDDEIRAIVDRIHAALAEPVDVPGSPRPLTVHASIGVAWAAPDGLDPEDLLQRADAAMYAAKTARRATAREGRA